MNLSFLLSKQFRIHLSYWVLFVLFFVLVWGSYDFEFYRNFMIQVWSLPARLLLVYATLFYLFPKYFLKERYFIFFNLFLALLAISTICIQRFIMIFVVQKAYLPYQSNSYFELTELMNTLLDINLALIIPFIYTLYKTWETSKNEAVDLQKKNQELIQKEEASFIYLKEGKTLQKVPINTIVFIESLKNYVRVKTTDTEIISYNSISAMEKMLPTEKFLRVHRSYIIAQDYITAFSTTQVNLNGIMIPIGRKYKETVKSKLGYY